MRTKIVSWLPESCSVSSPREGEFTQLRALFLKFGTCTESSLSKCASTGNHLTVRNRNQMLPCNLYYATERLLPLRLHESGRRAHHLPHAWPYFYLRCSYHLSCSCDSCLSCLCAVRAGPDVAANFLSAFVCRICRRPGSWFIWPVP